MLMIRGGKKKKKFWQSLSQILFLLLSPAFFYSYSHGCDHYGHVSRLTQEEILNCVTKFSLDHAAKFTPSHHKFSLSPPFCDVCPSIYYVFAILSSLFVLLNRSIITALCGESRHVHVVHDFYLSLSLSLTHSPASRKLTSKVIHLLN
jgi:hypothetical protein